MFDGENSNHGRRIDQWFNLTSPTVTISQSLNLTVIKKSAANNFFAIKMNQCQVIHNIRDSSLLWFLQPCRSIVLRYKHLSAVGRVFSNNQLNLR